MDAKVLLIAALEELQRVAKGALSGTKIEKITDVINRFAIFSAVGAVTAVVPGVGGVISMLTQTGMVWGTYIKINEALGITMKENVAKFIGAAMLTNISANVLNYAVAYIGASILAFLPGANLLMLAFLAAMGYALIYVSALLYLKLLTEVMRAKGSFDLNDSKDTEKLIRDVVNNTNVKEVIKEAQSVFEEAKESGEFGRAKKNPICPYCGEVLKPNQKFCSVYGNQLR